MLSLLSRSFFAEAKKVLFDGISYIFVLEDKEETKCGFQISILILCVSSSDQNFDEVEHTR